MTKENKNKDTQEKNKDQNKDQSKDQDKDQSKQEYSVDVEKIKKEMEAEILKKYDIKPKPDEKEEDEGKNVIDPETQHLIEFAQKRITKEYKDLLDSAHPSIQEQFANNKDPLTKRLQDLEGTIQYRNKIVEEVREQEQDRIKKELQEKYGFRTRFGEGLEITPSKPNPKPKDKKGEEPTNNKITNTWHGGYLKSKD